MSFLFVCLGIESGSSDFLMMQLIASEDKQPSRVGNTGCGASEHGALHAEIAGDSIALLL